MKNEYELRCAILEAMLKEIGYEIHWTDLGNYIQGTFIKNENKTIIKVYKKNNEKIIEIEKES